jgi:hypothetical protein
MRVFATAGPIRIEFGRFASTCASDQQDGEWESIVSHGEIRRKHADADSVSEASAVLRIYFRAV